jgi:outer membrane protein insertion porin family
LGGKKPNSFSVSLSHSRINYSANKYYQSYNPYGSSGYGYNPYGYGGYGGYSGYGSGYGGGYGYDDTATAGMAVIRSISITTILKIIMK